MSVPSHEVHREKLFYSENYILAQVPEIEMLGQVHNSLRVPKCCI